MVNNRKLKYDICYSPNAALDTRSFFSLPILTGFGGLPKKVSPFQKGETFRAPAAAPRNVWCAGHAVNLRGAGATPSPKGAEMTGIL